jgi:hypothetical protein
MLQIKRLLNEEKKQTEILTKIYEAVKEDEPSSGSDHPK